MKMTSVWMTDDFPSKATSGGLCRISHLRAWPQVSGPWPRGLHNALSKRCRFASAKSHRVDDACSQSDMSGLPVQAGPPAVSIHGGPRRFSRSRANASLSGRLRPRIAAGQRHPEWTPRFLVNPSSDVRFHSRGGVKVGFSRCWVTYYVLSRLRGYPLALPTVAARLVTVGWPAPRRGSARP